MAPNYPNLKWILKSVLTSFFFLLSACDPEVQIGWYQDFDKSIDPICVKGVLTTIDPKVSQHGPNKNDGISYYPSESIITSFIYLQASNADYIGIGQLSDGRTRYVHTWSRIGTSMTSQERNRETKRMDRVDQIIGMKCGFQIVRKMSTE